MIEFELPEDRIAQTPLADRASSRLMVVGDGSSPIQHRIFRDLPSIVSPGDLLVMNDTRVSARRLFGKKSTGASIEALLLASGGEPGTFLALVRPGKRLPVGAEIQFEDNLVAEVIAVHEDGRRTLRFALDDLTKIDRAGEVPLPPYIHAKLSDPERYQTVYAQHAGSAAAPTAGLHFTPELLADLEAMGVHRATVTLDVGLDTFRPISAERVEEHKMHGERCSISERAAEQIMGCKGRIFAIGTTSARTLESFAIGERILRPGQTTTEIFIRPGYNWQVVDGLITNFHMPRTTMLLMVGSLCGEPALQRAYDAALQAGYRFLSFGDSMFVTRSGKSSV